MKKTVLRVIFLSLTMISASAQADALSDFTLKIDKALKAGVLCENALAVKGRGGVAAVSCKQFRRLAKGIGTSRLAMKSRLQTIAGRMNGVACKNKCKARIKKTETGLIQVIYILDYMDFTRDN